MQISLSGKRAFVTAGGAGIGRSIVETLHRLGATVFTCDIDESSLADLPAGVNASVCDVADAAALDALLDTFLPGGLEILVNNAGIAGPSKLVEDVTVDEWRQTMAVGIDAQFFCARRVVPVFKARGGGVIVNLTSTAGLLGYPNRAPYAAAKWAVTGFTKTLAMELGGDNIRVNAIAPGSVNGDRMDRVVAGYAEVEQLDEDEVRRAFALGTSMQCFVDPDEIADLVAYLCSDHGRHISGQVIAVDGHTETLWPRS